MPPYARPRVDSSLFGLPAIDDDSPGVALILDDSEFDRRRIERLLDKAVPGLEILEAETIEEFEAILAKGPVDVVFIDHLLVGTDGLSALERLQSFPGQQAATPIMLATQGNLRVAMSAIRGGCADYLEKSELSVATLTETLTKALGRRLLNTALESRHALEATLQGTALRLVAASGVELRSKGRELLASLEPLATEEGLEQCGIDGTRRALTTANEMVGLVNELQGYASRGLRGPVGRIV